MTDAPRLPALTPDDLDATQRRVHDELTGGVRGGVPTAPDGSLAGPFNAMLHAPWVGDPLQELGAALRTRGRLPDGARELVVLAVAAHHRSAFEWWVHSGIAAGLDVDAAVVEAIRTGAAVPDVPHDADGPDRAVERAALDAARTVLTAGDLDGPAWTAAHAVLGDAGLVELTTLVGYYSLLAMQLRVFRVGLPDGVPDPW